MAVERVRRGRQADVVEPLAGVGDELRTRSTWRSELAPISAPGARRSSGSGG